MSRTVLVLGGSSDIGFAIARVYAANGWSVILAGRNEKDLARNRDDLVTRFGISARTMPFDVLAAPSRILEGLPEFPDTVVCVVGLLGDQQSAQADPGHAASILRTNFEGPALVLGEIANRMMERGSGTIVGISSVAGDRGRASNYVYGSAKAGFSAFLSGLRARASHRGVHVLTVKPGFVRTAMTAGMKLPPAVTAEPDEVGRAVYRAAQTTRRNVIYVRPVWRLIMLIIAHIPERIFKRLRF
jgi:hypothetical protein